MVLFLNSVTQVNYLPSNNTLSHRCARIPCILVKGVAKGASYTTGDNEIKAKTTWAVVHVAGSWRLVFPHWAFVKASGHQKGNWMLVEDCGNSARTR